MADEKFVEMLKSSKYEFGAYKATHRLEIIDLSDANFDGLDLAGVDFSRAKLCRTSFRKCDLSGAKFYGTDAREADFTNADLSGAKLQDADFRKAKLLDADLDGAKLVGTNLMYAKYLAQDYFEKWMEAAQETMASEEEE